MSDLLGAEKTKGMNIGQCVELLKQGHKMRRPSWNGKGMWIALMPSLDLAPASHVEEHNDDPHANVRLKVGSLLANLVGRDTPVLTKPYVGMMGADGCWQPGWVCAQHDLLADDWEIAE
jgi:hypothetical protein